MRKIIVILSLAFVAHACLSPSQLARRCAETFPAKIDTFRTIRDSVRYDTIVRQELRDMVIYRDTTICPPQRDSAAPTIIIKTGFVNCPPQREIIQYRYRFDSTVVRQLNTAALDTMQRALVLANNERARVIADNQSLTQSVHSWRKKSHWWTVAAVASWLVFLILLYLANRAVGNSVKF